MIAVVRTMTVTPRLSPVLIAGCAVTVGIEVVTGGRDREGRSLLRHINPSLAPGKGLDESNQYRICRRLGRAGTCH